mmetsp:Transcript_122734/g.281401  ORF Transcript_122734/g.281401 Transcript_122734/m.281401 type:complete len:231 (-) Transcript_122734:102-794(-)
MLWRIPFAPDHTRPAFCLLLQEMAESQVAALHTNLEDWGKLHEAFSMLAVKPADGIGDFQILGAWDALMSRALAQERRHLLSSDFMTLTKEVLKEQGETVVDGPEKKSEEVRTAERSAEAEGWTAGAFMGPFPVALHGPAGVIDFDMACRPGSVAVRQAWLAEKAPDLKYVAVSELAFAHRSPEDRKALVEALLKGEAGDDQLADSPAQTEDNTYYEIDNMYPWVFGLES